LISHFSLIWHIRTHSICVGHLITKILIEVAQGHISLSLRLCLSSPIFCDLAKQLGEVGLKDLIFCKKFKEAQFTPSWARDPFTNNKKQDKVLHRPRWWGQREKRRG
jgi:hypothetical protein